MGRIEVQGQPEQIVMRFHLQNDQSKMDWRCSSSGRAWALQTRSPEFKPQFHQKKKKKKDKGRGPQWARLPGEHWGALGI
jgi:hypothetical protein